MTSSSHHAATNHGPAGTGTTNTDKLSATSTHLAAVPPAAAPAPPAPPSTPLPLHCSGSYYVYTIIGLTLYTTILSTLFTATQYRWYKLVSFVMVTPLLKYCTQYQSAFSNRRVLGLWLFSNVADICTAIWMLYLAPHYCQGSMAYGAFPTITALIALAFEVLQYLLFDYGAPDQSYVIRLASNPLDYSLLLVLGAPYYVQADYIDWEAQTPWYSFLVWLFLGHVFDFSFGLIHYYTHRIPALWARHKTHHVYKRSELNSFANFYSDFVDSWIANIAFIIGGGMAIMVGGDAHYWSMDLMVGAVLTHNKYVCDRFGGFYFWEYDALCRIFQRQPTSHYHHRHHTNLNGWYGSAGFFSDSFFERYAPDARAYVPSWYQVKDD